MGGKSKTFSRDHLSRSVAARMANAFRRRRTLPAPVASEARWASRLNVSRSTVHNVMVSLEEEGLLRRDGRRRMLVKWPAPERARHAPSRPRAKNQVVEQRVLRKLFNGELEPGARFSELALAKQCDCTTVTMREVLLRVSRSGLIRKEPRKFWQVILVTREMIADLYESRELLETFAVTKFVKRPSDDPLWAELAEVAALHRTHGNRKVLSAGEIAPLDRALHGLIQKAMGNRYLHEFMESLACLVRYQQTLNLATFDMARSQTVADHREIIRCLQNRDGPGARKAVRRHLDESKRWMMSIATAGGYPHRGRRRIWSSTVFRQ